MNLGARKEINDDDIENFIGISKEFNVFELQAAIGNRDFAKAVRIVQYFESNPKIAPIQLVLPSIYGFFSKVLMVFAVGGNDEKQIAAAAGINPFFVKDYIKAAKIYNYATVEKILLLLHEYNLRSIGIGSINTSDGSLLKEMLIKIMQA